MSRDRRSPYVAVFLLVLFGLLALVNATRPRIMVIQKDHKGDKWARQVDKGIHQTLDDNRRPVSVSWHYLGLEQSALAASRVAAVHDARRAIGRIDPDVIIAIDDETNDLVAREYAGLKRPKVVYVSIDVPPSRYGYDTVSNVSGVGETLPLAAARDAMLALKGGRPSRLAVVGADCNTARAEMEQVEGFDWKPCMLVSRSLSRSWSDFRASVERAGREADVLLLLTFEGLVGDNGESVSDHTVATWVEDHAKAFPLGLRYEFGAEGGGLAITSAGDDEGAEGMAMALAWLDRPWKSGAPTPTTSTAFNVLMRPARLAQRGAVLPPLYREAARAGGTLYP